jgi:hypothetical protein
MTKLSKPAADPGSETIKPQWLEPTCLDQFIHLQAQAIALLCAAQIIVDHHPAVVRKPVAITVDIATNIGIGIKNKQPNLARAEGLPYPGNRVRIEGSGVYQRNLIKKAEAFQIFFKIFETVFRADARMLDLAASLDADDFLFRARIAHTHGHGNSSSADVRTNLENVTRAGFGAVVGHHNGVDAEHGAFGGFHELMVQSLLLTILDQLLHQLETVVGGRSIQKGSLKF